MVPAEVLCFVDSLAGQLKTLLMRQTRTWRSIKYHGHAGHELYLRYRMYNCFCHGFDSFLGQKSLLIMLWKHPGERGKARWRVRDHFHASSKGHTSPGHKGSQGIAGLFLVEAEVGMKCLQPSFLLLKHWHCGITEVFWVEKTLKITETNHQRNTTIAIKPWPQVS